MNMQLKPSWISNPNIDSSYRPTGRSENKLVVAEPKMVAQKLTMYVTIDTQWVTTLRHLVINTFSDIVSFIRIQPVDHARKMKVCLCFNGPVEHRLMSAIMQTLPSAEFGRISAI